MKYGIAHDFAGKIAEFLCEEDRDDFYEYLEEKCRSKDINNLYFKYKNEKPKRKPRKGKAKS